MTSTDEVDSKESGASDSTPVTEEKPIVTFVLGGPGAGKGTQCARLVDEFGFVHMSAGDLLRRERDSGSEKADLINSYIKEGKIVPVEITVGLLKSEIIAKMAKGKKVFIIDGFPRNLENLRGWETVMGDFAEVPFMVYLECTEDKMVERVLKRASESAADLRRVDDNEEAVRKRLETYRKSTMPIIKNFEERGMCYTIDANPDSILDVYDGVRRLYKPFTVTPRVVFVLGGPGSGKGTQCAKLVEEFPIKHLSAGDLLRAERATGSKDATLINEYIKEGQIVPVEITVNLIKKAMNHLMREDEVFNFVIDGFPRNFDNLEGWRRVMGHFCEVPFLLNLVCTEDEMTKRILERASLSDVKRIDDNEEAIRKRFKVHAEHTMPVVEDFRKDGILVEVDSMKAIDEVYAAVREHFIPLFEKTAE
jgi:UMP-CMP kinase family protein